MTHTEGETRIKALQKNFLCWVETHPELSQLAPEKFNRIRRRAFRATFDAFKLGRIGLLPDEQNGDEVVWDKFFDWSQVDDMAGDTLHEIRTKGFSVTLEAFRVGALVTGSGDL